MELSQKFTFSTKKYQYVASRPGADFPDTVLLFEPRIRHPALRVTARNFLFTFTRFFEQFAKKIAKKSEKIDFFKIFDFVIFLADFCETSPQ